MGEQSALVLLSGGIDSATAGAIARDLYCPLYAMTVEYGQAVAEKVAAIAIADWLGVKQKILCRNMTFTSTNLETNYYPGRNMLFLAHALQRCEIEKIPTIVVGFNADDYEDYPDCRPEFVEAFEKTARYYVPEFKVFAPLIHSTKAEVIAEALRRGVPLHLTLSCYHPKNRTPCGKCAACLKRKAAFEANGLEFNLNPLDVKLAGASA